MNPKIEQELERYLTVGKEERAGRDERNVTALQRIFNQLELHEQKDDLRHAQVEGMFKGHESRISKLETNVEDTGKHDIAKLNEQLKERKAWTSKIWEIALTAVVAVLVGAMGVKLFGK